MNIVEQIARFNQGRDPQRLKIKYRKMRESAFAFLRGSCHLFYDRLAQAGALDAAPLTWVCGDLHFENFGCFKGADGLFRFDINDFDEAALAPASWDLVRMLTSLRVGLNGSDSDPAGHLCQDFLSAYSSALLSGQARGVELENAHGLVKKLLSSLRDRKRNAFLDERCHTLGKKRSLRVDGNKALPASVAQGDAVRQFMLGFAQTQSDPDFFEVLDVARRIAGTGSLGLERYVILVRGKGSPDKNYLLDLKRAMPSSLTPQLPKDPAAWPSQAHRVVSLQRRAQAVAMPFLEPVQLAGQPYVLRALQPSEDRIAMTQAAQSPDNFTKLVETMGQLLAWSHLRCADYLGSATVQALMAYGAQEAWQAPLTALSEQCAQQTLRDAAEFNAAYDAGLF